MFEIEEAALQAASFKLPPALAGGWQSKQMALAETKIKYQSTSEL